ncbi:MAG: TIGR04282 family arsenosugar biosynthesis glycosyltransferase [Rhodospirillales bacterium]
MADNLIIFVKTPRLGKVKSRLAADIGDLAAFEFYRDNVAGLLDRLGRHNRWTTWLAVSPDQDAGMDELWPDGIGRFPQGAGDLGRRMDRALRRPGGGPAALIGGDVPEIGTVHIKKAFKALETHDWVFGPAADGGFWLAGFKDPAQAPYVFENVRWSTGNALADTLNNLPQGFTHALIDTLHDIDDGEAYERWRGTAVGETPA